MKRSRNKTKKELIEELEALRLSRVTGGDPAGDPVNDYHHVLDQIEDGFWETDLRGIHLFCNRAMARLTGYTTKELQGASYRTYLDPKNADEVYRHFNAIYRGETDRKTIVYDVTRKNGSKKAVEISVSLIRSLEGEPVGFRGIMRDITERLREHDLKESFNIMRKALAQSVQALSLALEIRDPYTAGHHRRVSDLARSIANEMGMTRDAIDGIRIAGSILDIGKISIPSEILSKPGRLTEIEFKLMKTHAEMGFGILKTIEFPWPVAQAVFQHHERMDGSGYPRGIAGEEIIPEGRILAVADVVEAMCSHRPYRRALGVDQALEEIISHRATLFDTGVVDACLALFRERGYVLKD